MKIINRGNAPETTINCNHCNTSLSYEKKDVSWDIVGYKKNSGQRPMSAIMANVVECPDCEEDIKV